MPRNLSELKTESGRWLDLLNNIGEVLLWSEEFGNGLSGKNDK